MVGMIGESPSHKGGVLGPGMTHDIGRLGANMICQGETENLLLHSGELT